MKMRKERSKRRAWRTTNQDARKSDRIRKAWPSQIDPSLYARRVSRVAKTRYAILSHGFVPGLLVDAFMFVVPLPVSGVSIPLMLQVVGASGRKRLYYTTDWHKVKIGMNKQELAVQRTYNAT